MVLLTDYLKNRGVIKSTNLDKYSKVTTGTSNNTTTRVYTDKYGNKYTANPYTSKKNTTSNKSTSVKLNIGVGSNTTGFMYPAGAALKDAGVKGVDNYNFPLIAPASYFVKPQAKTTSYFNFTKGTIFDTNPQSKYVAPKGTGTPSWWNNGGVTQTELTKPVIEGSVNAIDTSSGLSGLSDAWSNIKSGLSGVGIGIIIMVALGAYILLKK